MLSLRGVAKRFGRVVANAQVDFDLCPGEVHGLVGENGAGKTTLLSVLAGLLRADEGRVVLRGRVQTDWGRTEARNAGVGMVHQHLRLIDGLTVLENLLLAVHQAGVALRAAQARKRLQAVLPGFGVSLDFGRRVGDLDGPRRQWVAVAKLLVADAHVLLLDEPTAFIGPRETQRLLAFLRHQAEQGKAVAFVSHKLPEVLAVADRITVLRRGRVVGRVGREEATERALAHLMVGERAADERLRREVSAVRSSGQSAPLLTLRDVSTPDGRLRNIVLSVRAGEVLGIGGVAGNGQRELAQLLLGLGPAFAGEVHLAGTVCRRRLPRGLVRRLLAHIPGEVARRGLVGAFTVRENCLLGHQHRAGIAWGPWLSRSGGRRLTQQVLADAGLEVRPGVPVSGLSGGMQQRLVVARALAQPHRVLLAEMPSAGLDVVAQRWVQEALKQEAAEGKGVILITYDLDELLDVSDRVGVFYDGGLLGPYPRSEVSSERLADLMAGVGLGDG